MIHIGDHHEPEPHLFLLTDNCTCDAGPEEIYDNFTFPANFSWGTVQNAAECILVREHAVAEVWSPHCVIYYRLDGKGDRQIDRDMQ